MVSKILRSFQMFSVVAALIFGLLCLFLGFYGGYLLAENKNMKERLEEYAMDDVRYELERQFDEPD